MEEQKFKDKITIIYRNLNIPGFFVQFLPISLIFILDKHHKL